MSHTELEALLGAYALDAVDADERAQIELHLATCPRCRAELAAHREVATLLSSSGADAPAGLWERIGTEITAAPDPEGAIGRVLPLSGVRRRRRRVAMASIGSLVAAVVAAVTLLSLQVDQLNGQVRGFRAATRSGGLAPLVVSALQGPSQPVRLTSFDDPSTSATIAIGKGGLAYWAGSTGLAELPQSKTYQLWGLVKDQTAPVSLGVLGRDPKTYSAFRLAGDVTRLMVTVEPSGGTPAPTTPVLIQAPV